MELNGSGEINLVPDNLTSSFTEPREIGGEGVHYLVFGAVSLVFHHWYDEILLPSLLVSHSLEIIYQGLYVICLLPLTEHLDTTPITDVRKFVLGELLSSIES